MISSKSIVMVLFLAVIFLIRLVVVVGVPNMQVEFNNCAGSNGYTDAFGQVRDALMNYLVENTYDFDRNIYRRGQGLGINVYGNGRCSLGISKDDCMGCLEGVRQFLLKQCEFSIGGHCKVVDCELRYETYPIR